MQSEKTQPGLEAHGTRSQSSSSTAQGACSINTAMSPNWGSLTPCTTVSLLCPTLRGQIFAGWFSVGLPACSCAGSKQNASRMTAIHRDAELPNPPCREAVRRVKRCPLGAWEIQAVLHCSLIVIKTHTHPTKSPFVPCSPCGCEMG